jgi:hypothetical protein
VQHLKQLSDAESRQSVNGHADCRQGQNPPAWQEAVVAAGARVDHQQPFFPPFDPLPPFFVDLAIIDLP